MSLNTFQTFLPIKIIFWFLKILLIFIIILDHPVLSEPSTVTKYSNFYTQFITLHNIMI